MGEGGGGGGEGRSSKLQHERTHARMHAPPVQPARFGGVCLPACLPARLPACTYMRLRLHACAQVCVNKCACLSAAARAGGRACVSSRMPCTENQALHLHAPLLSPAHPSLGLRRENTSLKSSLGSLGATAVGVWGTLA